LAKICAVLDRQLRIDPDARPEFSRQPLIIVIKGSLAPDGALVKLAIADDPKMLFSGPAKIYHSREEAVEGLNKGEIVKGQVVLLRGMGVKGGPGMAMTSAFIFALDGAGQGEHVAVPTANFPAW
jgi:dihydroxy-acid dehydratase